MFLTHSALKILFSGHISKCRTNSESKRKFSESLFIFLQSSVTFYALYRRGYATQPPTTDASGSQGSKVNDEPGQILNFLFLSISFGNELKLSTNCNFSPLSKSNFLTHSALEYFEKLTFKKFSSRIL